jgi:hypothetical protein
MQEKQFAFIPWWISAVLSRNNLKTEDLLSFERIRPFFSTEDLTSLVAMSSLAHFFAGNGIGPDTTQWSDRWLASASDARTKQAIADIAALAYAEQTQAETLRRLAIEPSSVPGFAPPGQSPSTTFEVALMGDHGVAVHLKQGFTLAEHAQNSFNLLRCMVKKLYVYEDYPRLIARHAGQAYIESLMH